MKLSVVIPTYWGRESSEGYRESDAVYDHPTPLDGEGTLKRAIESMAILKDKDFELFVIAVPTAEDIEERVEEKVQGILSSIENSDFPIYLVGPSTIERMRSSIEAAGGGEFIDFIKLRGYPNVRNICLIVPHIKGADAILFIDDDEVFEDPDFISKAKEFIGKEHNGRPVYAVAGYYLQPDGGIFLKKPFHPWMRYWDQYDRMNEAFEIFIKREPRLKTTPFVFGGNMVIHRNLFEKIPFDTAITRGEDIDYLINAKMFGFDFFIDNQLAIKHLPPPKPHPTWKQLREDIYRFVFEREKLNRQIERDGLRRVKPEDLDPYPGCFLRDNLLEKISRASELLAIEYLSEGDIEGSKEALRNIVIAERETLVEGDPFMRLLQLQKRWEHFMEFTKTERVRTLLKGHLKAFQ